MRRSPSVLSPSPCQGELGWLALARMVTDDVAQHTTSNADPARARNAPKKSIAANFLILSVFDMSEGSQY